MSHYTFRKLAFTFILTVITVWSISAQVTAGFSVVAPVPNCNPAVYNFTNTSTGTPPLTYEWNFGVYPGINSVFKDPGTTYLGCGTFRVRLVVTDATGAKDSSVQTINVRCSPVANFRLDGLTEGCVPFVANFINQSTTASGTFTRYVWDFGDGYTDNTANPSHAYNISGCKNVTLIVTNSDNCTNNIALTNVVCTYPLPVSDFTSTLRTACSAPFSVTYRAAGRGGSGPYTYQWLFPGGTPSSSTDINPVVQYNSSGDFSATLITRDSKGCTDTLAKNNYVSIPINATDFTLNMLRGCTNSTFTASGAASSSASSWKWTTIPAATIANGTKKDAAFVFPAAGNYELCLDVTYATGCTQQKCTTIVIQQAPVADFIINGLTNTCINPNVVTFTNTSTGNNLTYGWYFNGGVPATFSSLTPTVPVVNYSTCGTFPVSLVVKDDIGCTSTKTLPGAITITCPVASFEATPINGCNPLTTTFNSTTTTGNPVSWEWSFGDPSSGSSNTSTLPNPTHTFILPGCYDITLTTKTAEGCTSTKKVISGVCTDHKPHANFSGNPPINCVRDPVFFVDSTENSYEYTEYFWDFHGEPYVTESNERNPSFVYSDTGYVDVTLIVSNRGCADTITKDNFIYLLGPVSILQVKNDCGNRFQATLDGTHSVAAHHYMWYVPNGNPSTSTLPVFTTTFSWPGIHTATLTTTNDSTGCTDVNAINFMVRDLEAGFTATPVSGCSPLKSCMSNLSNGADTYLWRAINAAGTVVKSDTLNSPCFTLTEPGTYSILLIVTDSAGCQDSLYRKDYITVYKPVSNFNAIPITGCAPLNVNFTNTSTSATPIKTYDWNFGDAASGAANTSVLQHPSHTYTQQGVYSVLFKITDTAGCADDSLRKNYIVVSNPKAIFSPTFTNSCEGTLACFSTDTSGNYKYNWNFGDGATSTAKTPCHNYAFTGTFPISLTVSDSLGCRDSSSISTAVDVIRPAPAFVADTTVSTCPPLQVRFTDLSMSTGPQSIYLWDFGDGQFSSAKNPSHIYSVSGLFDITLIVKNANGCVDSIVYPQYIHISGPSAYISHPPTSGCAPHTTCFKAVSQSSTVFTWNFGDGAIKTGIDSICYTYERSGTFYPELILSDGAECIFSLPIGTVNIGGATANFTKDNGFLCTSGTVNFTDSSFGVSPIKNWQWNFGDPGSGAQNSSTLQNPSHYYSNTGTYTVSLDIATIDGCTNSVTKTIVSGGTPVVQFYVPDSVICAPDSVLFIDNTVSPGSISRILWDFGDPASGPANTSADQNPSHYYTTPGTYTVTLIEVAGNGCTDTFTTKIVTHQKAMAAMLAYDTCHNTQPIIFTNQSQFANSYDWDFGDGNTATLSTPSHRYAGSGIYPVTLTARNSFCSDTFTTPVHVYPVPDAAFTIPANSLCGTFATLHPQNSSTGANTYQWNFGDGNSSSLADPTISYAVPGQYTIVLQAMNTYGCSDTVSYIVDSHQKPIAAFEIFDTCLNTQPIAFTNNTQFADYYSWDLGDAQNSTQAAPTHAYADTGIYTVTLIARTDFCSDTATIPLRIYPVPNAAFTIPANALCGTFATLNPQNISTGADSYLWSFGDGNSSFVTQPSISYAVPGQYTIVLKAMNTYGCSDTTTYMVDSHQKPIAAFDAFDTCLNTQPIAFANSTQFANYYNWDFGDAQNSIQAAPTHAYADTGTYTVTLIARTDFCSDTAAIPVHIYPVPDAVFTIPVNTLCGPPASFHTINSSTGSENYLWILGNGDSSTLTAPVITYDTPGEYIISLLVQNTYQCRDTAAIVVTVHQKAIAAFDAPNTCQNTQPLVIANQSQFTDRYEWDLGNSTSSALVTPLVTYSQAGQYIVTLKASNEFCADTLSKVVEIFPVPKASFTLPAIYMCGPPATLFPSNTSTGATSYVWNYGNDSSLVTTPEISFQSPGNYVISLIARNAYSCIDTASKPFIVHPYPTIQNIDIQPAEGCEPLHVIISANVTDGHTYTWNFGDGSAPVMSSTAFAEHTYTDTGKYTITLYVKSLYDCSESVTLTDTIKVHIQPVADFDYDLNTTVEPVNGTVIFTNKSQHAEIYTWSFGDGSISNEENPTHLYDDAGDFTVTMVAETHYGCRDEISKSFKVLKKTLYVPNAFAPGFQTGDGLVSIWKPVGIGLLQYHAQVFNTWGELLWESSVLTEDLQPAEGWDGNYQGKPCQQDVYVWKVTAVFTDGTLWPGMAYKKGDKKRTIGSVTLIR